MKSNHLDQTLSAHDKSSHLKANLGIRSDALPELKVTHTLQALHFSTVQQLTLLLTNSPLSRVASPYQNKYQKIYSKSTDLKDTRHTYRMAGDKKCNDDYLPQVPGSLQNMTTIVVSARATGSKLASRDSSSSKSKYTVLYHS